MGWWTRPRRLGTRVTLKRHRVSSSSQTSSRRKEKSLSRRLVQHKATQLPRATLVRLKLWRCVKLVEHSSLSVTLKPESMTTSWASFMWDMPGSGLVWTKCWRTGPRKERREKRRRRRKGRKGAKTDQIEMNESALGHVNGSDPDLGTEEGGTGAEGGETGAETVEVEEKRVGKRGTGAEIETGEGGAEARRGQGIDLEKGGAAGVATGVDDLEVQPAVVAC